MTLAATPPPTVAEVTRNGFVESVHRAHVVVVDADGEVIDMLGDADSPMLPRSCNKPLQAVGMLRCGLDLPGPLLALASGSHDGEDFHVAGVAEMLDSFGFRPGDLANPADYPQFEPARVRWIVSGRGPEPIAMNCSGKHAAMLATCRGANWESTGYLDTKHPLQVALSETVSALTDRSAPPSAVDGCGAPVFEASLRGLARAFGRLAAAKAGPELAVADAIRTFPEWASGTTRDEALLHRQAAGIVAKAGAEGTYAIGLADGRGVALKVDDGAARARSAIVTTILRGLGLDVCLPSAPVLGGGTAVGSLRTLPVLAAFARSTR